MHDWVAKIGGKPEEKEAILRLHARVMKAESLRPHKVLKTLDLDLINAENRVIIAPNEDTREAAVVGLIHVLNALGQSHESTKKLADNWARARAEVAKEHLAQQSLYSYMH